MFRLIKPRSGLAVGQGHQRRTGANDERPVTSVGIDIGGTSIKLAALRDGQVVWTGRSAAYARPTREQLIDVLRATAIPLSPSVLGVCLPGLFDPATRTITHSVNVPGLV